MTSAIRVRRAYDDPGPGDGSRILVDRLWPRGLRKDAAALDDWLHDAAPSTELRTWYRHAPAKFAEFRLRYTAEPGSLRCGLPSAGCLHSRPRGRSRC